ncbi:TusE/DsrC/DsvC family sulfur relay protein [Candidatus Thioglobus sp.]|jgi:tRNA 2-thiouridine synthesizing protein E|uniref:TusE/DsrC/DsvC family sulfur relay protein n=1 Tax=Candidatus Thioglobus sp. TaxID=2026721 RepID=UPI0001BD38ED|nr:TusE/DsrC/DsvC family sulfur relay protein [Candidatus Thioglobus sp.]EEZ79697.1 MAG: DsrC-like protein [uncultured Candidatus Thioglobus sp.]MBT3186517.1 TusE/DsrC/DsvC family sulfur relay protein [Candidatus Thioglobus sp.]MBT3431427.1 TusE/DsrC/DsvC family sulfur relay protein [Candidatus Thioglobus sp.]MBT3965434.1 TusE/DsrC/DsvC family sulfur relay protein [Candidatus Thioglobus sp.]MBT4316430.1 TusE/DsrC/DsvC family sulfur relay protein [Candidatus Thioglobus sp.]
MKINDKEIELDPEGYLIHPEDWDQDVALELAKSENVELSDDYWTIFDFMRSYYNDNGVAPDVRHTTKQMTVDFSVDKKAAKAKLFTMFPYGYVKQACKVSGMKRPRGWSTG